MTNANLWRMDEWSLRRAFLAALALALLISFMGVFDHALWTPDEPRDAEIGRAMLVSGDYVVPTLSGQPFLEKPPLAWWVMAGLYRIFGVSDGVARSASAVAAVLTLLLVFDLGRRLTSPFGGLMAVLSAATTYGFYRHFHRAVVDPWLAFFVMLGYWAFVIAAFPRGVREEDRSRSPSPWPVLAMYIAGGLAFLSKGLIGPVLIAGPVGLALLVRRHWRFLASWAHAAGLLIFAFCCALWPYLLFQRGGREMMNVFVVNNLLYRFAPPGDGSYTGGHELGWWYYLVMAPVSVLPWLVAAPALVRWLRERRMPADWDRAALTFLAAIYPIGALLLSVPGTKREVYLLPLIAPLGVTVGAWLASTLRAEFVRRIDQRTLLVLLIAAPLLVGGAIGTMAAVSLAPPAHMPPLGPMRPGVIVLLALAVAAAVPLTLHGLRCYRRSDPRLALPVAGLLAVVCILVVPAGMLRSDRALNFHAVTADLRRMNAFSPMLVTYRMDEVTRGLIPFDTGVMPRDITGREQLAEFIRANPGARLFMLERNLEHAPADAQAHLRLLERWPYTKRRTYVLFEVVP